MRTMFYRRKDPWFDLMRMQRELDRLVGGAASHAESRVYPPANFYKGEEDFVLQVEMPGVDPSSIDISTQRNELVVAGERKVPAVPEGASYHRRERRFGSFSRTFTLPETVDASQASARYADGVLQLRMPQREEARPRQIPVSA